MFPDKRGSSELVEMSWGRQCTERVQQVPFLPWGTELSALSPKPPTAAFGWQGKARKYLLDPDNSCLNSVVFIAQERAPPQSEVCRQGQMTEMGFHVG